MVKNYLYNLIYQVLNLLIPFLITPYIARVLGPSNLGIYAYTFSIVQFSVIIILLGVPLYGNRQIATVSDSKDKISKVFWSIYSIQFFVGCIILIFYLIYVTSITGEIRLISMFQGIFLIASLLDISWLLLGLQKMKPVLYRNIIIKILSVVLIFMMVRHTDDLLLYTIIMAGSTLMGQVILWLGVKRHINFTLNSLEINKHLKPVMILFLPSAFGQIYLSLDKVILNYYATSFEVGLYDQAMKIIKLITVVITSLGVVVLPNIAKAFSVGEVSKIKKIVDVVLRYILFISLPLILGIIAISEKFVYWYLGDEYEQVSTLLIIISPIILFIGLGSLFGIQILAATGQNLKLTLSILFGALVSISLNFIFVPSYGMYATSIVTLITEILVASLQLYYVRYYISFLSVFKGLWRYCFGSLCMFLILIFLNELSNVSLAFTVVQIVVGTISYIVIVFLLKDELLRSFIKLIKSKFRKG
ncbi:oligosaccharide flippase family protein [Terribacillus sp. JSM ZJ617]|uniref:oligosaccharide flippase family protein n=1 Tax=Terribacillus sp. JSM ZJ617 TaxID=3342119 RepID=UPI0035A82A79